MHLSNEYESTLQYLYEQLPMFSRTGKDAIKKDLTNIKLLCEALGNPEQQFKTIHIAGTNGKGSTSHMLAAVFQQAGYRTGLYTSPHLLDFRERFRINGQLITKEWVMEFVTTYKKLIETVQPSFFEITVAMAFQAFAESKVDIAIIETGLGGRLDSTNIIHPLLSIITNISYDHQDVLGNSLAEIAREKAGIIKPQTPVLIGEEQEDTNRVFFEVALQQQSKIYYAQPLWDLVKTDQDYQFQYFKAIHRANRMLFTIKSDLLGNYQQHNIRTVLAAIEILSLTTSFQLPIERAIEALAHVKQLTGLRGRWDVLQTHPLIVADVAHNAAGVQEVFSQWNAINATTKHIVVGFVKDKDVTKALTHFPKEAVYYFCQANIPRALPSHELFQLASTLGFNGVAFSSVATAVAAAQSAMKHDDALLITGSFFIVNEAMEVIA